MHFLFLELQMKRNHLTVRQMVGEAMSNMKCTGKGEWVDPSGKLVYVDDGAREGKDYKVQTILRRFYQGRIGAFCFRVLLILVFKSLPAYGVPSWSRRQQSKSLSLTN